MHYSLLTIARPIPGNTVVCGVVPQGRVDSTVCAGTLLHMTGCGYGCSPSLTTNVFSPYPLPFSPPVSFFPLPSLPLSSHSIPLPLPPISLGGNCKTVLITTVTPAMVSYTESLSSLKFANK